MYRIVVRHEKALGSIFFRPFAEKTLLNGNRRESTARVLSNEKDTGHRPIGIPSRKVCGPRIKLRSNRIRPDRRIN
ncbi:hypothetical protein BWD14_10170 [Leptospira santarosai]|uniref:Uncharacterized protein n=1 Tax=Leptospira santarosai TaxID=28183 RepID=A0AB73LMA7_9LEPT|nr:hypothetical protein BWD14_10170 [Leptospira santarosai]